ncbi:MAG: hypothetical protein DRJ50_13600, partial [Actinobacteria bacterium]
MLRFARNQRLSTVLVPAILVAIAVFALGLISAGDRLAVQDRRDVSAGAYVVVPIEASTEFGLESASFGLRYSTELLTPVGVYKTPLTQEFELNFDIATPGALTVDIRGRSPLFDAGAIVWILFENLGAVGSRSDLTLYDSLLNDLDTVDLVHGWVEPLEGPYTISFPTDLTGSTGEIVGAPMSIDDWTGVYA